ncbi:MAG: pectin acetylesterase-family hydrolase, partial [Kofleriaceae bacterium]
MTDAPDAPAAPSIATVLACGAPAEAGGLRNGTDLQRVDLDLAAFPNARCNDGTPGTFYFRPAATAAGAKRWVIQLQGGGACNSPDSCARRWCSVDTNFGMTQMTSTLAPATGIGADGILYRGNMVANPLADANQVFVRYCSSDGWSGTTGPLDVDAVDPVSGDPIRYRIDFRGRDILDAVIATLRRDGGSVPAYTLGGGSAVLVDLDLAADVLFAGASAGGAGAIQNADRVAATLRTHNTCVDCTLQVSTLIDSIFGPRNDTLDWSTSVPCTETGACTYEAVLAEARSTYPIAADESCLAWHATNAPDTAYLCSDSSHVVRNHVTTPMMVRMGLLDQLIGTNYIESGVTIPGVGVMTPQRFALLVHDQLVELRQIRTLAEEAASMVREPATFGPPCLDHETLSANQSVFDVSVTAVGGTPRTMLELYGNWKVGNNPIHAVWEQGAPVDCGTTP